MSSQQRSNATSVGALRAVLYVRISDDPEGLE